MTININNSAISPVPARKFFGALSTSTVDCTGGFPLRLRSLSIQ